MFGDNQSVSYVQGEGVEADSAKAAMMYLQAAEQGDEDAREVLDDLGE